MIFSVPNTFQLVQDYHSFQKLILLSISIHWGLNKMADNHQRKLPSDMIIFTILFLFIFVSRGTIHDKTAKIRVMVVRLSILN